MSAVIYGVLSPVSYANSNPCPYTMWALVDAHHFYVSCERLFAPRLKHRPIAILTGPQGCVISCSRDLKNELSLAIGTPLFKVSTQLKAKNTVLLRPNFELYGDLSSRIMQCLRTLCPEVAVYSIDEAFLKLTLPQAVMCAMNSDPLAGNRYYRTQAQTIAQTVLLETGIPVGVAIAPTKVLAKLAMRQVKSAKNQPSNPSKHCIVLSSEYHLNKILQDTDVEKLWGIGKTSAKKLARSHIHSAYALKNTPEAHKRFGVVIGRIALELSGKSCIEIEHGSEDQKQILCSKSYPKRLQNYEQVKRALLLQLQRATKKARALGSKAHLCTFFASGSVYSPLRSPYAPTHPTAHATFSIPSASSDPIYIGEMLQHLLKKQISSELKDGAFYRIGVILSELHNEKILINSIDMFTRIGQDDDRKELYNTMDSICMRYGKQAISLGPKTLYSSSPQSSSSKQDFALCSDDLERVNSELNLEMSRSNINPRHWQHLPQVY